MDENAHWLGLVAACEDAYDAMRREVPDMRPETERQQRVMNRFNDADQALADYRRTIHGCGLPRLPS